MNKKSTAIAINTIIIAAIALVVLLVVIGIFTGLIGNVGQKFSDKIESANNDDSILGNLACKEGTTNCASNILYECKDGKWVKKADKC